MRPYSAVLDHLKSEQGAMLSPLASTTPPFNKDKFAPQFQWSSDLFLDNRFTSYLQALEKELRATYAEPKLHFCYSIGTSQAYLQVISAITNPGETIYFEKPTYEPYRTMALWQGLKVEDVNRLSLIETPILKGQASAIVLTNPQSPGGELLSLKQVETIAKQFRWVILDEIFLPMFTPSAQWTLGKMPDNVIRLSGLNKTFGLSSIRLGWACSASQDLIRRINKFELNLHVNLPTFIAFVGQVAMKNRHELLKELKSVVEINRTLLQAAIQTTGFNVKRFSTPLHQKDGGHFCILDCREVKNIQQTNLGMKDPLLECSTFGLPGYLRFSLLPRGFTEVNNPYERILKTV